MDLAKRSDHIVRDISIYIEQEVERSGNLKDFSQEECVMIQDKLDRDCSGVYLPAMMVLKDIASEPKGGRSVAEMLENLPPGLQQQYQKHFDQLTSAAIVDLWHLLTYLTYSIAPLTVSDLAFVCSEHRARQIDTVPGWDHLNEAHLNKFRDMISSLGPMFRFRRASDTLEFVHPSAKKFFLTRSQQSGGVDSLLPPLQAHQEIAQTCMRVIIDNCDAMFPGPLSSADVSDRINKMLAKVPLFFYALEHWSSHLKLAADDDTANEPLMRMTEDLLRHWASASDGFRRCLLARNGWENLAQEGRSNVTPIELLSALGLASPLVALPRATSQEERQVSPGVKSAFVLAVKGGHEAVVDALIEFFDITALDDDVYASVLEDSTGISRPSLLRKVMEMRSARLSELVEGVIAAYSSGSREALSVLAGDGVIFKERTKYGRTALHQLIMALSGRSDQAPMQALSMVQYLVTNGVEINCADHFGFTALHYACWGRETCTESLIRGMIEEGADPFARTVGGLTAFHFAARYARLPDVVECFLDITQGAVLRARSNGLNTPLHWAAFRPDFREGDEAVLTCLIRMGADPYLRNRRGVSAANKAVRADIAECLKDSYQDLNGPHATALLFLMPRSALGPRLQLPSAINEEDRITQATSIEPQRAITASDAGSSLAERHEKQSMGTFVRNVYWLAGRLFSGGE